MIKKIHIIEDNVNILGGLQAKFSSLGMEVSISDGSGDIEHIMRAIIKIKPHYIILDLILPLVEGLEILQSIKANENIHSIPVFVFSDFSENDLKNKCLNLGADYYFVKNEFNLDQFVDKVIRIINNREKLAK